MASKQQWAIPAEYVQKWNKESAISGYGQNGLNMLSSFEVKGYRLGFSRCNPPTNEFSEAELRLAIAQLEVAKEKVLADIEGDIQFLKDVIQHNSQASTDTTEYVFEYTKSDWAKSRTITGTEKEFKEYCERQGGVFAVLGKTPIGA